VVVAEKVQYTVDEKLIYALFHIHTCRLGFLFGRVRANNQIAQQIGIDLRKGTFSHGERNDVGGPRSVEIRLVQPGDFVFAYKKNRKLGVRKRQSLQQGSRLFPYLLLIDDVTTLSVVDVDLHQYR